MKKRKSSEIVIDHASNAIPHAERPEKTIRTSSICALCVLSSGALRNEDEREIGDVIRGTHTPTLTDEDYWKILISIGERRLKERKRTLVERTNEARRNASIRSHSFMCAIKSYSRPDDDKQEQMTTYPICQNVIILTLIVREVKALGPLFS